MKIGGQRWTRNNNAYVEEVFDTADSRGVTEEQELVFQGEGYLNLVAHSPGQLCIGDVNGH